ncbi:MAG TPA: hypothetical protein VL221_08945 [Bacteroidota bacterium]|nr:hypothetical protein [Bacteroidota bacterium]
MNPQEEDPDRALRNLKAAIRTIVHDVSSPLGVVRMSVYYLQNGAPDSEKEAHYFAIMGENIEKIAAGLALLRDLSDETLPGSSPSSPGRDAS